MRRSDKPLSCARALVLLEPYIDDDLVGERRQRLELHLRSCVDCHAALGSARRIQVTLRDLPALQAPAAVRDKLAATLPQTTHRPAAAVSAASEGSARHWQDGVAEAVSRAWDAITGKGAGVSAWLRPAAAAAAIVLLVLFWGLQRQPEQEMAQADVFSEQELLEAQYQTRWALAYLARVTAGAGDVAFIQVGNVMGDVIEEHVMGSVTNAVGRSMQPSSEKKEPGAVQEEVQTP